MLGPANPDGTKRNSTWAREPTPGECDEKWAEMQTGKVPLCWTEAREAAVLTSEAFCHSGSFPFWIHSPPSAPEHGSLLVLLLLASSSSLVSFAGFSSPPQPRNVTASQISVLGPLLFPISPPQWWFIQGHACWSPVSSFDPVSKLQSPLSNRLLENPTGWLVDQSTHHTEPLTFCPLKLVSPSSPPSQEIQL